MTRFVWTLVMAFDGVAVSDPDWHIAYLDDAMGAASAAVRARTPLCVGVGFHLTRS